MKTVMKQGAAMLLAPVSDGKRAQLKYLVIPENLSFVKSRNKSPQRTSVVCKKSFTTSGGFSLAQNN
jgi:hypothetical protein